MFDISRKEEQCPIIKIRKETSERRETHYNY